MSNNPLKNYLTELENPLTKRLNKIVLLVFFIGAFLFLIGFFALILKPNEVAITFLAIGLVLIMWAIRGDFWINY